MTRDSKGQETPLDSKFDRDASTHQRKKVQNQKNFLGGHKIRPQDLLSKVAKSVRWWNYLVSITRWAIALLQRPFVRGIANILGVYHQMIRINVFWIVGNKFQTGKQIPNRETNWETICETIGKQSGKQIGKQMSWAIHMDTQAPQGLAICRSAGWNSSGSRAGWRSNSSM